MARINGIVSGFDTESLVKAAVANDQAIIDRLNKANTKFSWKKERYTALYKKMEEYRKSLFNFTLESTTKPKKATSSNMDAVGVKANADAVLGNHVMNVTQLAAKAQTGSLTGMGSAGDKTTLDNQFGGGSLGGNVEFILEKSDGSGPVTINLDTATESINDLVKKINESGAGVTASYDATLDRFFISSNEQGANQKIDFSGTTDPNALNILNGKLNLHADTTNGTGNVVGKDAIFDFDGVTGITNNSNTVTIGNVEYSLNAIGQSNITVASDTDAILDTVQKFVDSYNSMLEEFNGARFEQKYKGYEPLTQEQKNEMTETQIKAIEDKAKSGILRGDNLLGSVLDGMRGMLYNNVSGVDGKYKNLSSIGLTTGNYSDNGKLEIDMDKLKAALEEDPDVVGKLFGGGVDRDGNKTEGIANQLYSNTKVALDKINTEAGSALSKADVNSSLAKAISRNEKTIANKIALMNKKMDTYYKKYDAMENLLQQLQKQQESLSNSLGM